MDIRLRALNNILSKLRAGIVGVDTLAADIDYAGESHMFFHAIHDVDCSMAL